MFDSMINRLCSSMKIMKWNIYFDSPVLYIVEETFVTFVKSCIISNWRMVELEFRGSFFTDEKRKWNIRVLCIWSVIKRSMTTVLKFNVYTKVTHTLYISSSDLYLRGLCFLHALHVDNVLSLISHILIIQS